LDVQSRWFEAQGHRLRNVMAVRPGRGKILVIGAHYDTVPGSPGADDNASAVAVLLELAHQAQRWPSGQPIYFVAFSNEEAPNTRDMGSARFVNELSARHEDVQSMICLEMLGYYDSRPGSQKYPALVSLFYPSQGNFVGLVANLSSRSVLKTLRTGLSPVGPLTFSAAVLPSFIGGIDRSDHTNFWKKGIPAVMVTDTAFYRNPNYHRATDTADTLNYARMAELSHALDSSLAHLASPTL
jgi:Zn-dependent M28 family amino/carboxypeptidase